jgi:hypothetical protein
VPRGRAQSPRAGKPGFRSAIHREAPIPRRIERLLTIALALGAASVRSEDPAPYNPAAAALAAVDRGLAYLLETQEADGSWRGVVGRKVHTRYVGHDAPHVGITALAGSSLLARGGPAHREAARRALRWILDQSREDGFIAAHGSRMYSHAFATIFLARALRSDLVPDARALKGKLQDAAGLIVLSQNAEGGWRYLPGAADSDISVTALQVTALREARDAGIEIPDATFQHAVKYVQGSFAPVRPTDPSPSGAFYYQLPGTAKFGPRHGYALAAAGVAALADARQADSVEAAAGRRYLVTYRPSSSNAAARFDYYYGQFHALRAHRSEAAGYPARRDEIIRELQSLQASDGTWSDLVGPKYATAMATLVLQEALLPPGRGADRR